MHTLAGLTLSYSGPLPGTHSAPRLLSLELLVVEGLAEGATLGAVPDATYSAAPYSQAPNAECAIPGARQPPRAPASPETASAGRRCSGTGRLLLN
jgi:hypothetical protein